MENQKSKKIAEIREHYKTEIDEIKQELCKADILKNEKLRDILFAKEIENFNKNENKQVQNLNDYIVNDIIDRLVNEIYEQIKTNDCPFDDFKLKISLNKELATFFQSNFNIKKRKQKSQVISIVYDFDDKYKEDTVTLPPRKQLFNIGPLTRICVDRAIINEKFKIKIYGNGCRCQFQENFGENNKNKQPELILEKDDDVYNIILNNNDTITISKEDSEENDQQKLIDEIQSNFFQEDETIKTLFENLEYELTDEQMKSYNKIKELLGYKKISVEQPKVKYDLCGMNNYWIVIKSNGSFGCCGW